MKWQSALAHVAAAHEDHVLVTVLATIGSAPRDAGAKMVVTTAGVEDTIGGGQLEQMVINQARALLDGQQGGQTIQHYPLAAAAEQCCGGSVTVLFEAYVYRLKVAVFGAGYVGRAAQSKTEANSSSIRRSAFPTRSPNPRNRPATRAMVSKRRRSLRNAGFR